MKKEVSYLIVGIIIGLVIGGSATYLILNNFRNHSFAKGGNFNLDENTKNQITSFFESSPSQTQLDDYCNQNRMYCIYYCRQVNPSSELCAGILNSTNFQRPSPQGGQQ